MPGGRAFSVILFAIFVDVVGFGMIVPVLPFINLTYGGDTMTGTGLVSIYALMTFIGGPIWGRLSDRFGRRPMMLGTFIGAVLSYILLANAESLLGLYVARGFAGLMAGNVAIAMATAADLTTKKDRGKAMGYIGAAFGFGFALGPAIGGIFSGTAANPDISLPSYFAAGTSFMALALTYAWFPETRFDNEDCDPELDTSIPPQPIHVPQVKHSVKDLLWPLPNGMIFLFFLLCAMAQSATFAIVPFWAEALLHWDQQQVGFLLMAGGIAVAIVQTTLVGLMFQKLGEFRSMIIGCVVAIIGALMMLGPVGIYQGVIALPMIFSGLTITYPGLNSVLSLRTSRNIQGEALGLSNGMSALGRVAGPISAAWLFTAYSPKSPFLLVTFLGVIVIIWALWEMSREKKGLS